jgi:hypothetical protein
MACDADHDHCLREGTWLAKMPNGYRRVHPVFAVGDAWYDWDSLGEVEVVEAYLTRPATADDLVAGTTVVFAERVPEYESEAYHDWRVETVFSVDAARGKFEFGSGSAEMPVAAARVIVETR